MKTSQNLSESLFIFNYLKLLRVFSNDFCEGFKNTFLSNNFSGCFSQTLWN